MVESGTMPYSCWLTPSHCKTPVHLLRWVSLLFTCSGVQTTCKVECPLYSICPVLGCHMPCFGMPYALFWNAICISAKLACNVQKPPISTASSAPTASCNTLMCTCLNTMHAPTCNPPEGFQMGLKGQNKKHPHHQQQPDLSPHVFLSTQAEQMA